jgi:uncharacterized protein (TIGR02266 family)
MHKQSGAWQGRERRRHPRKGVWLEIYYGQTGDFFNDYAVNLSRGGLFMQTAKPLAVGTELKLRFSVPDKKEAIETSGRVVRVVERNDPAGGPPGIGIEFSVLTERDLELINSLWEQDREEAGKKCRTLSVAPNAR